MQTTTNLCRGSHPGDTIENNHDKSVVVTAYKNQAKGSASTAVVDADSIALTIEKALAIASLTEADPAAGLADAELFCRDFKDLQTNHPTTLAADDLVERIKPGKAGVAAVSVSVLVPLLLAC